VWGAIEGIPVRPKAPVRAALLEVKAIVDCPLATLAPLERHRSLPDRKRRQEKEFLRQDLGIRIWGSGSGRSGAGGTKDGEFGACGQAGDRRTGKLAPRLCSTRALARTLASTRRAAATGAGSFQEDESQPRQSRLED
jgi:hypothetical protein